MFLLLEPVEKSPYPPIGLMRIATMLKHKHPNVGILAHHSADLTTLPENIDEIFITTLFTWEIKKIKNVINDLHIKYPKIPINVGGIAATIAPLEFEGLPNVTVLKGLHPEAENLPPNYNLLFGRKLNTSITSITRGCVNNCKFCFVPTMEGRKIIYRETWQEDISDKFSRITFWDNNFLAIPNLEKAVEQIYQFNKTIDFNQGLDAYYFDTDRAKLLSKLNLDCIRFAFDTSAKQKYIEKAIANAKEYIKREISVYVLYGYNDSPEDLFERINLLNKLGVCSYPMRYRSNLATTSQPQCLHWTKEELRGFNLSLYFYYRKGMISNKRESFINMYGSTANEFKNKLYHIYKYDRELRTAGK